jgi:hypothetical protein
MDNPIVILIVIGIAGAALFFLFTRFLSDKKKRNVYADIERRVFEIDDKRVAATGLNIWVEDIAAVTADEIRAIEQGLLNCFEKAEKAGYTMPLSLKEYSVAIVGDCMRAPESGIWCYKLPAGAYAGTEWDLGGYILAAGQVVSTTPPHGNVIVLPDHKGGDLEQLSTIAMYEAEHIILYHSDREKFEQTQTHGVGTGHPLF